MSLTYESDTITAIATPPGVGGISVIRVSGESAIEVVDRGFVGRGTLASAASHTAHFGVYCDAQGKQIDSVVATVFKCPHSYTGENTIELSCHGGPFLTRRILRSLLEAGARLARPGEFTKRAFLNGRLDLAQAEAVADLIRARSDRAHQSSLSQLNGQLSQKIRMLRDRLVESIGLLELELDFVEEGYEFAEKSKVAAQIRSSIEEVDRLISTYRFGRVYKDGVRVALAGAPNVGKSSLLNALLRQDRAIVTDIPGTTRDVIDESIILGGIVFTLSDTAGIRATLDPIEQEGVRRTEQKLSTSDILVLLVDVTDLPRGDGIPAIRKLISNAKGRGVEVLIGLNKMDLRTNRTSAPDEFQEVLDSESFVLVSAKTGEGIEALESKLVDLALLGSAGADDNGIVISSERHLESLKSTRMSLSLALGSLEGGQSSEFAIADLRGSLESLGEIIGVVSTEDILNSIFAKFCIGK